MQNEESQRTEHVSSVQMPDDVVFLSRISLCTFFYDCKRALEPIDERKATRGVTKENLSASFIFMTDSFPSPSFESNSFDCQKFILVSVVQTGDLTTVEKVVINNKCQKKRSQ